jgi:hypothetical protein
MKRFWAMFLVVGLCWTGSQGQASAEASKIATSLGDLRWGMSESDVITFVRRKIAEQYESQISKAKGSKQSQLREDMKRAQTSVKNSQVSFDGSRSRWDSSAVAGEFTYGNSESMVVYEDEGSQNYYFFINGRLWKWYKAFDTRAFGGSNFKKFTTSIEKKFGKGHAKSGELSPGQGKTQWVEYLDRNSRLRAADNTKRGVFALIFEEMETVRDLASLRGTTTPSRSSYAKADDSDSESGSPRGASMGSTRSAKADDDQIAKANTRKSIFAQEQQTETDAEYKARKQRLANEEREKQRSMHSRKEEAKKGEALKQIEGINDSDPLGGL